MDNWFVFEVGFLYILFQKEKIKYIIMQNK